MPILDERHDFAHPVEPDTAWSESYYFNAYDPVTDTGLFTRIGVRPNEGTMDVGLSVWLPGTDLATVHGVRPQPEMTDSDLAAAGVRYERLRPMAEWRITCDAEAAVRDLAGRRPTRTAHVALDLVFRALTPAVGSDGQGVAGAGPSAATRASVGKGHLEQAGRWRGWIEADGVNYTLGEARGNRDKSWGPRRWGGPAMWRWFSINVGDGVHFGGIRIGTEAGDLHRGWVWRDGELAIDHRVLGLHARDHREVGAREPHREADIHAALVRADAETGEEPGVGRRVVGVEVVGLAPGRVALDGVGEVVALVEDGHVRSLEPIRAPVQT